MQVDLAFVQALRGANLSSADRSSLGPDHLFMLALRNVIELTSTEKQKVAPDDLFVLAKELGAVAVHLFMLVPVGCGQEFADGDMLSPEEYEQVLISSSEIIGNKGFNTCFSTGSFTGKF